MEKKLNIIDISSYQSSIDLDTVFSLNPLNGAIVKTSEGTRYINPDADRWIQWLLQHDKVFGFYHFLNSDDPIAEAKYFYTHTSDYFHKGIPVADFEDLVVSKYGTFYLRKFLDECYSLSGIRPMVYCSLSVIQADKDGFRPIAEAGNKLWVAQYADMNEQWLGTSIWQNGSVEPFKEITMHQYTGVGCIHGYDGRIDLDIFYGDEDYWQKIASGEEKTKALKAPDPSVVSDVLHGYYGILDERTRRLLNEDYDAQAIQEKINELYGIAENVKKDIKGNEPYLNCIEFIVRSI